jgi:hypothetical protein
MSRWMFDTIWIVAAILGIVLTVMYFRAAQKLYARDKKNAPWRRDAEPMGESRSSKESSELLS